MVTKKRVKYRPSPEEVKEFANKGINGWCLENLVGNWCVHEVMKVHEDCQYPEYHLLVDNFADLETVQEKLVPIVPAMFMVKPFLTSKLLTEITNGD